MHAGEGETSILLDQWPEVVWDSYRGADHRADHRPTGRTVGHAAATRTPAAGEPRARLPCRRSKVYGNLMQESGSASALDSRS